MTSHDEREQEFYRVQSVREGSAPRGAAEERPRALALRGNPGCAELDALEHGLEVSRAAHERPHPRLEERPHLVGVGRVAEDLTHVGGILPVLRRESPG